MNVPVTLRLAASLLILGLTRNTATATQPNRPNVIILLADDLGFADVGFHGCQDIPTPHLDRLANQGVQFSNGYVSGPYCSPSRAGMLTGRYQQRYGHEFNSGPPPIPDVFGLPVEEKTIADRLQELGYATSIIGKWHLGSAPHFLPQRRGFQEFFGFLEGQHPYLPGTPDALPIYRGEEPVDEHEYLTDAFTREAVEYIERNQQHPFFLFLSFNAVHTPQDPHPKYFPKFSSIEDERRRNLATRLTAMDEGVGRVLDRLSELNLENETIVIFLSDNGAPPSTGSSNAPFRGRKATTWEGGIRIPFVIRWPGHISPGTKYDLPIIQLDLLPTILCAAGHPPAPADALDGVDLLPYLSGENPGAPHDVLYWRFGKQMAIRRGDWKLVRGRDEDEPHLYNLANDPGETTDLASSHKEIASSLLEQYAAWNRTLQPPRWVPPNQRNNVE
ncbi:sulfatase [Planctomicrobium sp. SH661]|uniref:sulfatase n=1 Tax=Planctomicrobium sp. SH661 TaxID=3448124 RepID=UPI003F5AF5E5